MVPSPGAYNIFTVVDKSMHRHKRKVLSQGFSDHCVRAFEPTILRHVDTFVDKLFAKSRPLPPSLSNSPELLALDALPYSNDKGAEGWSAPLDMTLACRYLGYDIMGAFGFGQSFDLQQSDKNHFLIDAVTATSRKAGVYVLYPALQRLQLEKLFYKKGLAMREKYLDLMSGLVKESKQQEAEGADRRDLLGFLKDAKDPETGVGFSEGELWAESRFLLIAGEFSVLLKVFSVHFLENPLLYFE